MTTPDPELDPKADPNRTEGRFSGIHPDNSYPLVDGELDLVQEMKAQARQESARTRRESSDEPRDPHPPFTERTPGSPEALSAVNPTVPTFNTATDTITIPTETGVRYYNVTNPAAPVLLPAGGVVITVVTTVEARPDEGYRIPTATTKQWVYDPASV